MHVTTHVGSSRQSTKIAGDWWIVRLALALASVGVRADELEAYGETQPVADTIVYCVGERTSLEGTPALQPLPYGPSLTSRDTSEHGRFLDPVPCSSSLWLSHPTSHLPLVFSIRGLLDIRTLARNVASQPSI